MRALKRPAAGLLAAALVVTALVAAHAAGEPAAASDAARLSGREIYERVLQNRFDSFLQHSALVSGDRGGNEQAMRLEMSFQSFRDPRRDPIDGETLSKSIVRYTHPFDIRHSGYLVIHKRGRIDDQFVYRASQRRISRVNLRKQAIFGTDFSFEDIVPREVEDARYERQPDTTWQGRPVLVVVAHPLPRTDSEYSRFEAWVDPERWVPLRTRYWDDRAVEVKELVSPAEHVERHGRVWVPMRSTMRNLRQASYTALRIEKLEPDVALERSVFDVRRLESH